MVKIYYKNYDKKKAYWLFGDNQRIKFKKKQDYLLCKKSAFENGFSKYTLVEQKLAKVMFWYFLVIFEALMAAVSFGAPVSTGEGYYLVESATTLEFENISSDTDTDINIQPSEHAQSNSNTNVSKNSYSHLDLEIYISESGEISQLDGVSNYRLTSFKVEQNPDIKQRIKRFKFVFYFILCFIGVVILSGITAVGFAF